MLNITTITRQSVGAVARYYADAADDYYAKDGSQMQWAGAGAETLGLEGAIDAQRFRELMSGHIDDNTKLRRVKLDDFDKERLGYDLTFSAPKGVSLQGLVHGDARIVAAHDKAVAAALKEAESLAMARTTIQGKTSREHTGNLVAASFRHETSRELDPQLHTHSFVMNMTQRADGQWRALTNDGIVNSLSHLGNVYKAALAKELTSQGFELRFHKGGTFDLAHISDEQIAAFSRRSGQIEKALTDKGLDRAHASPAEKDQIALATRRRKTGAVDPMELRTAWQQRSREAGVDFERTQWAGAGHNAIRDRLTTHAPKNIDDPVSVRADECVQFAIDKLTERQTIISEGVLHSAALEHGYGVIDSQDVHAALARQTKRGTLLRESDTYQSMNQRNGHAGKPDGPALTRREWVGELQEAGRSKTEARTIVDRGIESGRLTKAAARFTTPVAQQRERDTLAMERAGRNAMPAIMGEREIAKRLDNAGLTNGQEAAVKQIVTSRHQISAVQGYAGTGKSYMTTTAQGIVEREGYRMQGLAMYTSQVGTLRAEGIESQTVAAFLRAKDKKIDAKTVVVLDEAGVVPARQMRDLMQTVTDHGARLVMLGDVNQTKAIEAGKPMEQLMAAGMQTAYMTDIQRQQNPELRRAVELAAQGKAGESLDNIPGVTEVKDATARHTTMATDYMAQGPADRANSIVLSGTNESRRAINHEIRSLMGLVGSGSTYELMHREDTTQAERRHSRYYAKGAVVVPERDYKNGLQRGAQYRVTDTGPGNRLTVVSDAGERIQFNPSQATKLSVYRVDREELARGDQVKIQRNVADLDLRAGERFRVRDAGAQSLLLEGERGRVVTLPHKGVLPVAHAYSTTVHSSQGLTEDRIYANLDSKSKTTSREVYYVAVSRARHEARLYTDSYKRLPGAVQRATHKPTALELRQDKHAVSGHTAPEKGAEKSTPAARHEIAQKARETAQRAKTTGKKDKRAFER